jgi:hypothetical protein
LNAVAGIVGIGSQKYHKFGSKLGKLKYGHTENASAVLSGQWISALQPAKTRHQGRVETTVDGLLSTAAGRKRVAITSHPSPLVSTRPTWLTQLSGNRSDTHWPSDSATWRFADNRETQLTLTSEVWCMSGFQTI